MAGQLFRLARQAGLVLLFAAAAMLGIASGVLFAYADDLPQITALDDYAPSTITRVFAAEGQVIGEFALERRLVIPYDEISPVLRQAVVSAEDAGFDRHVGLSMSRILVTLARDIIERRRAGASTLTQQLARNLFLTPEKTWERKIKEAILAIQIEKRYTKPEIFTFYCNQIYLGHGAYGVEAASRLYFDKHAKDLSLIEAALVAGIIQSPERQSPFVDQRLTLRRRNYVLTRMEEEGYIDHEEAERARKAPIGVRRRDSGRASRAGHFVEEVRKYLEARYGAKRLYESGLSVYTTLDVRLQQAAVRAVDAGLRSLDKRHGGFRRPENVLPSDIPTERRAHALEAYRHDRWTRSVAPGDTVPALVVSVQGVRAGLRLGSLRADLEPEGFDWTGRRLASELVRVGDLVEARVVDVDAASGRAHVVLEQPPAVEGALLALENGTGRVLAMVGGSSFERSKFNRAVQARRQMGSTFKAMVYATAIDRGYTASASLLDAPVAFTAGPGQPPYAPGNYDGRFEGSITLRHALEKSRNVPTVRLLEQLGPKHVVEYARRFGFESPLAPFLSLALGASEATLLELTSAYSVFPNQGVRMRPHYILRVTDREGNVLEENRPEPTNAIRADTAYVMTSLLEGVIDRGTAVRAASIRWPLAGKTGTVDDFTDAWFVGFDPVITVGVWVGYDQKKPLGRGEDGARAALPVWISFMTSYIGDRTPPAGFPPPGNIVFLPVDPHTGRLADAGATAAIKEAFIAGTEPVGTFSR